MVSGARHAVSGPLDVGGIDATRNLANEKQKAWGSWTYALFWIYQFGCII